MSIKKEKLEEYQEQTYRGEPTIPVADEETEITTALLEQLGARIVDVRTSTYIHRTPQIPLTSENLRESGLLWLINAAIFHPRGFAMYLSIPNEEEREAGEVDSFGFWGDGTDVYQFGDSTTLEFQTINRLLSCVTTFERPVESEESSVTTER